MERFSKWLTPIIALFFVTALSVTASSTIGTDISTGGDLTVDGATTFNGTVELWDTVTSGGGTTFNATGDGAGFTFSSSGGGAIAFTTNCINVNGVNYCGSGMVFPYSCAANQFGQYYNTTANEFCVCDGSAPWKPIDAGSVGTNCNDQVE